MAAVGSKRGVQLGLVAYLLWGLLPVYWKQLGSVPPLQILAHRVVWSLVFLGALLFSLDSRDGVGRWAAVQRTLRSARDCGRWLLSAFLLALNWGVYIWAVNHGFVLESSLGYFMAPLIYLLLGVAFLGERLRRLQLLSVALAGTSVAWFTVQAGVMPWIGLSLAVTIGFYGLLRKGSALGGIEGLFIESIFMAPVAVGFLCYEAFHGRGAFLQQGVQMDLLLILAGVVTAVPLILYVNAVKLVTLLTIGLLQYVAPTCQFLLAVGLYGEPFTTNHVVLFGGIWAALLLYSIEGVVFSSKLRRALEPAI